MKFAVTAFIFQAVCLVSVYSQDADLAATTEKTSGIRMEALMNVTGCMAMRDHFQRLAEHTITLMQTVDMDLVNKTSFDPMVYLELYQKMFKFARHGYEVMIEETCKPFSGASVSDDANKEEQSK